MGIEMNCCIFFVTWKPSFHAFSELLINGSTEPRLSWSELDRQSRSWLTAIPRDSLGSQSPVTCLIYHC